MRQPTIEGIASIDCPKCGRTLRDFDPPQAHRGVVRVSARCHACGAQARFEIVRWLGETAVSPLPPAEHAAAPAVAR